MFWKGTLVNPSVTLPRNVATVVDHPGLGKRFQFETVTLDTGHTNLCSLEKADSSFGGRFCTRVSRGYITDAHFRIRKIDVVVSRPTVSRCCWYGCPSTYSGVVADAQDQDKVAKLLRAILKFGVSVRSWGPWVLYSGQAAGRFLSHKCVFFARTEAGDLQSGIDNDTVACIQVDENKLGSLVEEEKLHPDQISINNSETNDQPEIISSLVVVNTLEPLANMIHEESWLETHDKMDIRLRLSDDLSYEVGDSKEAFCKDGAIHQVGKNKPESPIADMKQGSEQSFSNNLERIHQSASATSPVAVNVLQQLPSMTDKESWPEKCDKNSTRLSDTDSLLMSESESTKVAEGFSNVIQNIVCYAQVNEKKPGSLIDAKLGPKQSLSDILGENYKSEASSSPDVISAFQQLPSMADKESGLRKLDENGAKLSDADDLLLLKSESIEAEDMQGVIDNHAARCAQVEDDRPESHVEKEKLESEQSMFYVQRNDQPETVNRPVPVNCSKQLPHTINEEHWFKKIDQNDISLSDPDDPSLLERASTEVGALQSVFDNDAATSVIGDEHKAGSLIERANLGPKPSLLNNLGRNDQSEFGSSPVVVNSLQELRNMMDEESLLKTCDENDTGVSDANSQTFLKSKSTKAEGSQSVVLNGGATHVQTDEIMTEPHVEEARLCPEQCLFNNLAGDERPETASSLVVVSTLQQMPTMIDENSCLEKCDESDLRLYDANDLLLLKSVPGNHAAPFFQAEQNKLGSLVEEAKLGLEQGLLSNLDDQSEAARSPFVANTLKELQNMIDEDDCYKACTEINARNFDGDDQSSLKSESLSNAAVILFDIETTGFKLSDDRIVEFAARDLAGGECSTLQTLVNPERPIPVRATNIHGIDSEMVNRSDIPRWKEVAPVLIQFVETRRHPGGPVILIAHNGRKFDVPFLFKEFERCSLQIPPWWRFVDTMPLAREAMKATGLKGLPLNLSALHEYYDLPFAGHAHRALADVSMLASVLQQIMVDLKMPVSALLEKAFTAEDVMKSPSLPSEDSLQSPNFIGNLESNSQEIEYDHASFMEGEYFNESTCMLSSVEDKNSVVPWEYGQMEGTISSQDIEDKERATASIDSCLKANEMDLAATPTHQLNNSQKHISYGEQEEIILLPTHQLNNQLSIAGGTNYCLKANEMNFAKNSEHQLGNEQEHPLSDIIMIRESCMKATAKQPTAGMDGKYIDTFEHNKTHKLGKNSVIDCSITTQCQSTARTKSLLADPEKALKEKVHYPTLRTDNVDRSQLTPMLKQYVQTKLQRPNLLLMWRVGDFYEVFFEDAEKVADVCNIGLAAVEVSEFQDRKVPMVSFHFTEADRHIQTLLSKGVGVVKQDQASEKTGDRNLPIPKETLVLTPGTALDEGRLFGHLDNHLVAVMPPSDEDLTWGLAYSDISTGECYATQDKGRNSLVEEILRLQPSEIIYPADANCITNSETGQIHPYGMPPQFCYSGRPSSDFHLVFAKKMLQQYIGIDALEQFELESIPFGIHAAGGLLGYIVETRKVPGVDLPLRKISPYFIDDYMHMDKSARSCLEVLVTIEDGRIEGSLLWAMDHTKTAMGKRMLRKWLLRPLLDKEAIYARLNAVEVFVNDPELRAQVRHDLSFMNDLERLAGRIAWDQGTPWDLLALGHSINLLPSLQSQLEKACWNPYFSALGCCKDLFGLGQKIQILLAVETWTVIQDGSFIKDDLDEALDTLRCQIKLRDLWLKNYEECEQERLKVPSLEIVENQVGEHFIIIQKDELKDRIIPIDYQSYSETRKDADCFITASLIDNSRKRHEAVVKARLREAEILRSLRQEVLSLLDKIQLTSHAVASIDILSTFAEVSASRAYSKPLILEGSQEITVVSGRHPTVEMWDQENSQYVPNSVYMGYQSQKQKSLLKGGDCRKLKETDQLEHEEEFEHADEHDTLQGEELWPRPDLIILTGPPASGKSCYLKQIGLIQLLAQIGSFVPAKEAKLGIADAIYMKMGSLGNVPERQSFRKPELMECANILNRATNQSLVLLDGIGRDMFSQEGSAVSRAMIEFLAQYVRARTLVSTHYDNLHHLEREFLNISNYCFGNVEIEDGGITYHHRIKPGFFIQSCALAIAKAAGLPEWVCSRAEQLLSCNVRTGDENFQMEQVLQKKESTGGENSHSEMQLKDPANIFSPTYFAGSSRKETDGNIISWPSASPSLKDAVVGKIEVSQETQSSESANGRELNDIWQEVCKVLQNQPATYALAKQKGSLLSIDESPEVSNVCISSSALFVKKFQQYEHATALESAFTTILQRPVQLKITVTIDSGKHH